MTEKAQLQEGRIEMKWLFCLIVLVQVSSEVWINPSHVTGLIKVNGDESKTRIRVTAGEILSDWPFEKVKKILEEADAGKE